MAKRVKRRTATFVEPDCYEKCARKRSKTNKETLSADAASALLSLKDLAWPMDQVAYISSQSKLPISDVDKTVAATVVSSSSLLTSTALWRKNLVAKEVSRSMQASILNTISDDEEEDEDVCNVSNSKQRELYPTKHELRLQAASSCQRRPTQSFVHVRQKSALLPGGLIGRPLPPPPRLPRFAPPNRKKINLPIGAL